MLNELLVSPLLEHVLDLVALESQAIGDVPEDVRPSVGWVVVDLQGDCRSLSVARGDLDAEEEAVANSATRVAGQTTSRADEDRGLDRTNLPAWACRTPARRRRTLITRRRWAWSCSLASRSCRSSSSLIRLRI